MAAVQAQQQLDEEQAFTLGPLSVLTQSVKANTQARPSPNARGRTLAAHWRRSGCCRVCTRRLPLRCARCARRPEPLARH
jgi:hypothetical protein